MARGDFERWLLQVIGDEKLAQEVSQLSRIKDGELLRMSILEKIKERINELERMNSRKRQMSRMKRGD